MSLVQAIGKQGSTAKWVGIFLIVAGFLSLVSPLAAGLSVTVVVGAMMLASGVAQTVLAFRTGAVGETIALILIGLLSVFAGGYMLFQPGAGLAALTLMLAGYFAAQGILEIIAAFGARPSAGWGWLLFGGAVSLVLGVMIWSQFPVSGVWAVGTLVGARLLVSGFALMNIGSAAKRLADAAGGRSQA
jgi:uncharacterized membrane protein HdeD (DUF308 family)